MKKRVLALLLVIVMIAGLAVGCGKSPAATNDAPANSSAPANNEEAQPAASGEKLEGTLNIFQFKVEINDALVAATKRYMELNPGVKVNLETVGGGDDYGAALRTKMQSSRRFTTLAAPRMSLTGQPILRTWQQNPGLQIR